MAREPGGPVSSADSWSAAQELAKAVSAGRVLPRLNSPVLLEPGETLHASLGAAAWRYQAVNVAYGRRQIIPLGGPILFGLTAAAVAKANRRARLEAEQHACPQWRPLGHVPVLATSHRLLVLHRGAWASVWYEAIRQIRPALQDDRLELTFEYDPPYALQGPWVAYLAVVLTTALAERVGTDAVAAALLPG